MVAEVTARVSQLDVSLGGSRISPDLGRALTEIEVMNSLNLPDAFMLRFHLNPIDGRASDIPDDVMSDYLSQGTEVVISERVGNRDKVIFDGEVTARSCGRLTVMIRAVRRRSRSIKIPRPKLCKAAWNL